MSHSTSWGAGWLSIAPHPFTGWVTLVPYGDHDSEPRYQKTFSDESRKKFNSKESKCMRWDSAFPSVGRDRASLSEDRNSRTHREKSRHCDYPKGASGWQRGPRNLFSHHYFLSPEEAYWFAPSTWPRLFILCNQRSLSQKQKVRENKTRTICLEIWYDVDEDWTMIPSQCQHSWKVQGSWSHLEQSL